MHDLHLWQQMQKANDEFEEFKEHLRRIKLLLFRLLATTCRLILSVVWYITVCTFPISYWAHSHYLNMTASRPFVIKATTVLRAFPCASPVLALR